jgi:UDP-N-acetylmuramoyl-tripeptide--D-alanyl-D-alanine ligase
MIDREASWVASAAGGGLVAGATGGPGPRRAVVDSREVEPGDLFVGLVGASADGGEFAAGALEAGAWGALVGPHRAGELAARAAGGAVIAADNTLLALQRLARAWRRELRCPVIGITGSTGKTSTKDIMRALLAAQGLNVHANRQNWNTEIGLPLSIIAAERGVEVLVLEMAMRGEGQIAELVEIAEPDVGVIVNVGPVHLELLGTVERVAAAKAELIRDLHPQATCVIPVNEPLLDPHRRNDIRTISFGEGGDVELVEFDYPRAEIDARGTRISLELSFSEPHNVQNALAAVAAATALGIEPQGRVEPEFSSYRGEVVELEGGVTVVNDCYNANPMSMRAALDHLAGSPAERRLAILGTMAELGPDSRRFHREIGEHAAALDIDVLVTVGGEALAFGDGFDGETHAVATPEEAGALLEELAQPGDRVLVKGSRAVGLERVLA